MRNSQLPSVELTQGNPVIAPQQPQRRRWKIFISVLVLTALVGLSIVYVRSPIYRASASVLTVQPRAIDTRSVAADVQHSAIQQRLLLGEDLLGRLIKRMQEKSDITSVEQLLKVLSVIPVQGTNLLELRAEGSEPNYLQTLVNAWAETYDSFRAEEIQALTGRTTAKIKDESQALLEKIEDARAELQVFRRTNQIVGLERGENTALSSLKGLNNSLNKTREKLIEAQARKAAVDEASLRGETVIPEQQKAGIAKLRMEHQRLKQQLLKLDKKYTRTYMQADPNLRDLPDKLVAKELDLAEALHIAHATAKVESTQAVQEARLSLQGIEKKLSDQREAVELFNKNYKVFKALEENLRRLEVLQADNAQRLAQIEVRNLKKFPPIQVVEWARLPKIPISPDYDRDMMIALATALGLALFITWLFEYLLGKPDAVQAAPQFGVHVYPAGQPQALSAGEVPVQLTQTATVTPELQAPSMREPVLPRELSGAEVQALLASCDPVIGGSIALLLSGISPYELSTLHASSFDTASQSVKLVGASARELEFSSGAWSRIEPLQRSLEQTPGKPTLAELDQALLMATHANRLQDTGTINALALWHTYVLYLVRQGISREGLTNRVGAIPPDVLDTLMQHAHPSDSRATTGIDFSYSALSY